MGNLLENGLFYAPKDRLGGAVFLRGTGMAFARTVLEAHAWDVKKRGEVLQDMVEDVVESPTVEPSHREPLLETAKTLCTDLQDLYRTIRVVLKTQTPDYHTAVWKKSSRSRK